ncbi:MAG: glycosyltransferase family 39 protein [Saprospiraceae bacterium]|nr:glycosyltransferase family 39 protein [Saprospiraceae bacterium]
MKYPLLLGLIWILLIFLVNPIGDFPLNDDWQYAYPVKQMVEEGQFSMQGQFAPNILLQVVYGYLSCRVLGGFDFTYLRFGILVLGLGCGLLLYHWLQPDGNSQRRSFGISLVLITSPLFFSLSHTFMTDVPFLFLCILSLFYFSRYVGERRLSSLLLASSVAVAAYAIRQPGILFLLGFAVYVLIDNRRRTTDRWLIAGVLLATGMLAYWGMEKGLKPLLGITDNYVPVADIYFTEVFSKPLKVLNTWAARFLKTFIYIGIFTLPLAPFLGAKLRQIGALKWSKILIILLINIILFGLTILAGKTLPFGGNVWFNWGLGPELLKDVYTLELQNTPQLREGWLFAIQILGQLQISAILVLLWRTWSERSQSQQAFIVWLILMNGLYLGVISIFSYFDRFTLLCFVSCLYILSPWLAFPSPRYRWVTAIPFTLILYFSSVATKDYLNWNRARAAAFAWLQQEEIGIEHIDAGYEYNGWHNYHRDPIQEDGRSFWWVTDEDYLIAFGPVQGYRSIQVFPYYRYLWWKKDQIWVLQREK